MKGFIHVVAGGWKIANCPLEGWYKQKAKL